MGVPYPQMDVDRQAHEVGKRFRTPWEGVERRAVAASAGSAWVAVSRGGHGEVHLVDAETGHEATRVRLSTPLRHGGHMALCGRKAGVDGGSVGR